MSPDTCPKCKKPIPKDAIACSNCRLVVRYFCEKCNSPVYVGSKFCTKCGETNKEYSHRYDPTPKGGKMGARVELGSTDIDKAFDEKSMAIAREIAELKATLGGGGSPRPTERVVLHWHSDVVLHSKGRGNIIHIGFGTDPDHAKGVPGILFFTGARLVFFSYLDAYENVSGILAYFTAELHKLTAYDFNPEDSRRNYLAFENHGILKHNFPDTRAIMVNFTWSTSPERGAPKNQAFILKSMLEWEKLAPFESPFPGGDYLFIVSTPRDDPLVKDVLVELESIPEIRELVRKEYNL